VKVWRALVAHLGVFPRCRAHERPSWRRARLTRHYDKTKRRDKAKRHEKTQCRAAAGRRRMPVT